MKPEISELLSQINYAQRHKLPYVFTLDQVSKLKAVLEDEQPAPKPNSNKDCWLEVLEDMKSRRELGIARYGTALQPNNGRNSLRDAYEEALDLCVYLKQCILESDGIKT